MARFSSALLLIVYLLANVHGAAANWACQAGFSSFSFCNSSLGIDARIQSLLEHMSMQDKVANTYAEPGPTGGSSSLGIPSAIWWNEATHGATNRHHYPTTFFPMPSLTACAFNISLFREIANVIGKEGRAAANVLPSGNWDYWAPHVNLVRDPRWGRAQETPGEDPFLTAHYAIEFIRGLQEGDAEIRDPRYNLVTATVKHFTAYDFEGFFNSNPNRFDFDAVVTDQDLLDTYNVPFQAAVQSGRAGGVMCSYTSVNGVPSCANKFLLQQILREEWDFSGYVVGDCGAVQNINSCLPSQRCHNYTQTNSSTVAAALQAGVTMDCGDAFSSWMSAALVDGSVTTAMLDGAVGQNMYTRFRVGVFDSPASQPYAALGNESVCTPAAQALSQRAAEESMVLLKLLDNALPLPAKLTRLALIGPNINNSIDAQMCSYYSTPCGGFEAVVTPLQALATLATQVDFEIGCDAECSNTSAFTAAIAAAAQADATVLAVGLTCQLAGEGRDRGTIDLPGHQIDLIRAVCAAARGPCVVAVFSGSSLDLTPLLDDPNVHAVVFVGYPGPWGGTALARMLSGTAKPPAGRLSQTWYSAQYTSEVDPRDMGMRPGPSVFAPGHNPGHTHRFYTGPSTVFPFGYGLSFTTFKYSSPFGPARVLLSPSSRYLSDLPLRLESPVVANYSVNVTNTGTIDSDDVVLGFLIPPGAGESGVALQELFGFQRVFVPAGQTITVYLGITARQLTHVTSAGRRELLPGMYAVRFGVDVSRSRVAGQSSITMPVSTFFMAVDPAQLTATDPPAQDWAVPPLGWNSWFAFDTHLNETLMQSNAEGLVRTGLAALGFRYLNLDGGWQGGRYHNGSLFANTTAFPSGISALASYAHSLGLYLGGYTDRGGLTCDGRVGSQSFEKQDAAIFAEWGVDFVKEDSCFAPMNHVLALKQFSLFQDAINATGRPMFFSLCGWLQWYANTPNGLGQSWRIGPDALSWQNVLMNFDAAANAATFVSRSHYADVDEIMGPSRGRPISYNQTRTQVALIAIIGSPLLLSFDLSSLTSDDPDVSLFTNPELLAIHQDPAAPGPYFRRLVGNAVGQDKRPPSVEPCDDSSKLQQWEYVPVTSSSGTLRNLGTAVPICLHAGPSWFGTFNHAQMVWLADCGGRMCDPNSPLCLNQAWSLPGNGSLLSAYFTPSMAPNSVPGPFVTLDTVPNSLYLETILAGPDAQRQMWTYNASGTLQLRSASGSCVAGYDQGTTNVWGRRLFDGAWAMAFVNFGSNPAAAVCDSACFAAAGFEAGAVLRVRDVWQRADLPGSFTTTDGYSVDLLGNGNSVLLRFSRV